jgi:hypothetical protein
MLLCALSSLEMVAQCAIQHPCAYSMKPGSIGCSLYLGRELAADVLSYAPSQPLQPEICAHPPTSGPSCDMYMDRLMRTALHIRTAAVARTARAAEGLRESVDCAYALQSGVCIMQLGRPTIALSSARMPPLPAPAFCESIGTEDWACHAYEPGQSDVWCEAVGEHEGYRYTYTQGENSKHPGCGKCWCCRQLSGAGAGAGARMRGSPSVPAIQNSSFMPAARWLQLVRRYPPQSITVFFQCVPF